MLEYRWGIHVVREALRAGSGVEQLWIERGRNSSPRLAELLQLARARGVPAATATRAELDRLAGSAHHQGVVAHMELPPYSAISDVMELARIRGEDLLALVLDGVQDPQNLGAILRTADAAGVHGVIIPERGSVGLTQAVARASAGASAYVPVVRMTNLARELEALKQRGAWVYGLETAADLAYDAADYLRPLAIVVGSEGRGLRRLVREACDALICIPMRGQVESLNVSVATSLVIYHAWRARGGGARRSEPPARD